MISVYTSVKIQVEKLLENSVCLFVPGYRLQLLTYKEIIEKYKALFKSKLAVLLPHVREGKIPLSKLEDIINDSQSLPFSPQRVIQWVDVKKRNLKNLK